MRLLSIAGKLQEQSACGCQMEDAESIDDYDLFRPSKASILVRRCKSVNGTVDTPKKKGVLKSRSSPTSPKKVHFADSNGYDLVEVKKYTAVSEETSDWFLPKQVLRPRSISVPPISSMKTPGDKLILPCFSLKPCFDSACLDKTNQNVNKSGICLENVATDARWLTVTCRVWNYHFVKEVSVRFTFDGWDSFTERHATHVSHAEDGLTDRFQVSLHVPKRVKAMEFALRYRVDGMEFWDNNRSQNYRVVAYS
ncbi:protein phosphatase 1 regulatory subunit 3C-like [Rhopilema esculentum]|uniref:protein phosphatase 1 regulatory subunit 3C-like n=1 Tax=Rhopilema esculentum TaxID=499914 RepID=UPI0031D53647|eukprot:gene13791-4720_t